MGEGLAMSERARYRVTGSIFLIALAVIFLPMLFDGAGAPLRTPPAMPTQSPAQSAPSFADVVPTSDVVERVEVLRGEVDDDGFTTDTQTRFGEPVLVPADDATSVWAVQAASFANRDNARTFRESLRTAGFEAFISTARRQGSEALMYRVAIGPLLSKPDAESMRLQLAVDFDVSPTVVEMNQ